MKTMFGGFTPKHPEKIKEARTTYIQQPSIQKFVKPPQPSRNVAIGNFSWKFPFAATVVASRRDGVTLQEGLWFDGKGGSEGCFS
jgi:hypothetical protein